MLSAVLCLLTASPAARGCDAPVRPPDAASVRKRTSDPRLDGWLQVERQRLVWLFGVSPNLILFDDASSPNAFASAATTDPSRAGTVALGLVLLEQEMFAADRGEPAVAAVLAHEWSHILQLREGCVLSGKQRELHADFLAGYYLGWRHGPSPHSIAAVMSALRDKGDYSFGSATHHGTPDERVRALIAGFAHAHLPLRAAYQLGQQWVMDIELRWQFQPLAWHTPPLPGP